MQILEIIELDDTFNSYAKDLEELSYLGDLSEENLWAIYSPCL